MKRLRSMLIVAVQLLLAAVFMTGCGGGGGDSGGGGGETSGIVDNYTAENMVKNIYYVADSKVMNAASHGSSINVTVQGTSGSATVTGKNLYSSGVSCGSSCVSSTRDVDVTIVFNNYTANSMTNVSITLNGTIIYKDYYQSTQNGTIFSSSDKISLQSTTAVQASMDIFNSTTGALSSSYQDTIAFSASGKDEYSLSGSCKAGNGTTYNY